MRATQNCTPSKHTIEVNIPLIIGLAPADRFILVCLSPQESSKRLPSKSFDEGPENVPDIAGFDHDDHSLTIASEASALEQVFT